MKGRVRFPSAAKALLSLANSVHAADGLLLPKELALLVRPACSAYPDQVTFPPLVWAVARARFEAKRFASQQAFDRPHVGCAMFNGSVWKPAERYCRHNLPKPVRAYAPPGFDSNTKAD